MLVDSLHSDYVLVSTAGYKDNARVCVGRCWLNLFTQTVLVSAAGYEDNDRVCIGRCWLILFTQTMYWLVLQVMKTMTESVFVGAG